MTTTAEPDAPVEPGLPAAPAPPAAAERPLGLWLHVGTLLILLSLASGATGALLVLWFQPPPPPLRIAVIDMTRVTQAAATGAQDATTAAGFPGQFDRALQRLQEEDPGRLLLVREAVLSGQVEDVTPLLLTLLPRASGAPPARPAPRGPHAPTP